MKSLQAWQDMWGGGGGREKPIKDGRFKTDLSNLLRIRNILTSPEVSPHPPAEPFYEIYMTPKDKREAASVCHVTLSQELSILLCWE